MPYIADKLVSFQIAGPQIIQHQILPQIRTHADEIQRYLNTLNFKIE